MNGRRVVHSNAPHGASSFEQQYEKIVGTRYAELDEINAQVAEQLA